MKKMFYISLTFFLFCLLFVNAGFASDEDSSQGTATVGEQPSQIGPAGTVTFSLLVHSRPNVQVMVYETDGNLVANQTTDENGAVEFELESGKYYVVATYLGQEVYSEWFYLTEDKVVTLKFDVWMVMKGLLSAYWKFIVGMILLIITGVWLWRHKGEKQPAYIPKLP